jgi:hypothetical protein
VISYQEKCYFRGTSLLIRSESDSYLGLELSMVVKKKFKPSRETVSLSNKHRLTYGFNELSRHMVSLDLNLVQASTMRIGA